MDEALQVHKIEEIPSPADFASQIELRNVPAVIEALILSFLLISSQKITLCVSF